MKKRGKLFKIQKKLGFIFTIIGFSVGLINLFTLLGDYTLIHSLLRPNVYLIFIFTLVFLGTTLWDHTVVRFLQVLIPFITGAIAILDVYNSVHGLGLIFLSVFIAFKYGYLKKLAKVKISIILFVLFGIVVYSARLQYGYEQWMAGINAVLYISLFLLVSYIILKDEINGALENQRQDFIEPIDLDHYGITMAERRVLEILVSEKASDREIADKLFLSVGTIKNHIHQIKIKLGLTTRYAVIDMCRNNYKNDLNESGQTETNEPKHYLEKER